MPASPRKPRDVNQLAASILHEATDETPADEVVVAPEPTKNPAAVALGKLGGAKGGKARAAKLTPDQRSEAAKLAVAARWKKGDS